MNFERFANVLGEEYDLIKKVILHYDEFQNKIGKIIKDYAKHSISDNLVAVEGGVGTGLTSMRVLESDKRIKVIGIDNELRTLAQARLILKDYGNRVVFKEFDLIVALKEMADKSADIFVAAQTIHNFTPSYRLILFNEIARILKSGGLFVNGDKYAPDNETEHQNFFKQRLKDFEKFDIYGRPDLKQEWIRHNIEDEEIRFKEGEQINILKELDFCDIKVVYRNEMEAIVVGIRI